MENFIAKHKIVFTLLTMFIIAGMGLISMLTINHFGWISVWLIIWSIPTILGLAFCLIAGIGLLSEKGEREQWQKIMLIGLWFLLVSGGSCGMLWGLTFGTSVFM